MAQFQYRYKKCGKSFDSHAVYCVHYYQCGAKEMNLSITIINQENTSAELLADFKTLDTLKKTSKKSNRWITCSICGKTVLKNQWLIISLLFTKNRILKNGLCL